jgi:hypothetical protein
VLLLAVPWLLLAGFKGADLLRLEDHWRPVAAGATGWLLFATALARQGASTAGPSPVREGGAGGGGGGTGRVGVAIGPALAGDWPLVARLGALGVAVFPALLLQVWLGRGDAWRVAGLLAWLDVALVLAAWAALVRSRDLATIAALAAVPALHAGIWRLNPTDHQAFAVPIGLYLLALAVVIRRDGRPWHTLAATIVAALGLLVLIGTSVVQSFERDRFDRALLALAEGLVFMGTGIAMRWRVLVVGGVAGVVVIAVRQLFDAVAALPGWAILGGSGLLLLGVAVALLLARARLAAAGRSVAERWSSWD